MIIHKCDKCGVQVAQKKGERPKCPEGWCDLAPFGYGRTTHYEICPECQEALGLPKEDTAQRETITDNLIDILSEIAQEAVQE